MNYYIISSLFEYVFDENLKTNFTNHYLIIIYLFTQILYNSVFMKQNSGHLPERRPSRTNGWACKYV